MVILTFTSKRVMRYRKTEDGGLEAKPGTGLLAPAPVLNGPDTTAALQSEGRIPVTIGLPGQLAVRCGHKPRLV
jgi:hypothetical protein